MARFFQTEDGSLKKRQSDVLTVVSYAVHPASFQWATRRAQGARRLSAVTLIEYPFGPDCL